MTIEKDWIQSGSTSAMVRWAEEKGKSLTKESENLRPLTTSQMRRFFGELRRIEANYSDLNDRVVLLKPKLAYAVGRDKDKNGNSKTKIVDFYELVKPGLDHIRPENESDFKNFVKVVEAIVAFHKFYGAKD